MCAANLHTKRYDEVTWNATVDKMLLYDVGMSGQFLGETAALIELARVLNRTADATALEEQQAAMAAKVQQHLWSAEQQIYLNFQVDSRTFNKHSSPTSFYPMLSGTATVEQALAMTRRWLTNHSRCATSVDHARFPASIFRRSHKRFHIPSLTYRVRLLQVLPNEQQRPARPAGATTPHRTDADHLVLGGPL